MAFALVNGCVSHGPNILIADLNPSASLHHTRRYSGALVCLKTSSPQSSVTTAVGKVCCRRYLACARQKLWWMTPEFGTDVHYLPPETQFLLTELGPEGPYATYIPLISHNTFRSTLRGGSCPQELCLRSESGNDDVKTATWGDVLYLDIDEDPFKLVDRSVAAAAELSGGGRPRWVKEVPEVVNQFGWCTWDAFYSRVSLQSIQQGLRGFQEGGCSPRFLIIDDGWQVTAVDSRYQLGQRPHQEGPRVERKVLQLMGDKSDKNEANARAPLSSCDGKGQTFSSGPSTYEDPNPNPNPNPGGTAQIGTGLTSGAVLPSPSGREVSQLAYAAPAAAGGGGYTHPMSPPVNGAVEATGEKATGQPSILKPQLAPNLQPVTSSTPSAVHQALDLLYSLVPYWPVQMLLGLFMGVCEVLVMVLFTVMERRARQGSPIFQLGTSPWGAPLREILLRYYAATGDHSKRLIDIQANSKFTCDVGNPGEAPVSWDHGAVASEEQFSRAIAMLQRDFGLSHIYCWHALHGYWSGVSAESPGTRALGPQVLYPKLTPSIVELEPSLVWSQLVLSGLGVTSTPEALFGQLHAYLARCGVSGVKVDVQSVTGLIGTALGQPGAAAVALRYQTALEDSIRRHFPGNNCINCMCHSTENLYRMRSSNLARVSDDFYPRDPASHTTHVAVCAYNSLFMGALVVPDWDMFQSCHPRALLHANARVVSGGPLYVSDRPGHHNFNLIQRLVLKDGSILRALLPGRPTRDCLFIDPMVDGRSLLKIWNQNRYSGLVGVFNVQGSKWDRDYRKFKIHAPRPPVLTTTVGPSDVEGLTDVVKRMAGTSLPCERFLLCRDGEVEGAEIVSAAEKVTVRLDPAASSLVTVVPILTVDQGAFDKVDIGPLGLVNMLNPSGAIEKMALEVIDSDTDWGSGANVLEDGPEGGPSTPGAEGSDGLGAVDDKSSWGAVDAVMGANVPSPGDSSSDAREEDVGTLVGTEWGTLKENEGPIRIRLSLLLRGSGPLVVYCSRPPVYLKVAEEEREFSYSGAGMLTVMVGDSGSSPCLVEALF